MSTAIDQPLPLQYGTTRNTHLLIKILPACEINFAVSYFANAAFSSLVVRIMDLMRDDYTIY